MIHVIIPSMFEKSQPKLKHNVAHKIIGYDKRKKISHLTSIHASYCRE